VDQVKEILTDWKRQGVNCLVLDLRDNAGGYFPAGVGVAGLFLPNGKRIMIKRQTETNFVNMNCFF
jgi:carboxyl-terminal processing protease